MSLEVVSGNLQLGTGSAELDLPLVVRVVDEDGHPIEGQLVNFRVTSGGGSVFAGAGLSSEAGLVRDRWTLGPAVPDTQRVEARAVDPESGDPIVFATFVAVTSSGSSLAAEAVTVGGGFACALVDGGQAACWGYNESGQLGDGTTTDRTVPALVASSVRFTSISAGGNTACGLDAAGAAWCWGLGAQNGDGTSETRLTPVPVVGGLSFSSLSVGWGGAICGLTGAGTVYCWGRLFGGMAGDGNQLGGQTLSPVPAAGGLVFSAISVGASTVCGLRADGTVYCWGACPGMRCWDGTTADRNYTPTLVSGPDRFASIAVGAAHMCGLTANGTAFCWGINQAGELGTNDLVPTGLPTAVETPERFVAVSAGAAVSCGLRADGAAFCWGLNEEGAVGDGTTVDRLTPVLVAGGYGFTALAPHPSAVQCGLGGGIALCWGSGGDGQLGNGSTAIWPSPTPVSGL